MHSTSRSLDHSPNGAPKPPASLRSEPSGSRWMRSVSAIKAASQGGTRPPGLFVSLAPALGPFPFTAFLFFRPLFCRPLVFLPLFCRPFFVVCPFFCSGPTGGWVVLLVQLWFRVLEKRATRKPQGKVAPTLASDPSRLATFRLRMNCKTKQRDPCWKHLKQGHREFESRVRWCCGQGNFAGNPKLEPW